MLKIGSNKYEQVIINCPYIPGSGKIENYIPVRYYCNQDTGEWKHQEDAKLYELGIYKGIKS